MSTSNEALEVNVSGFDLLNRPLLNKGTAFSEAERDMFHLHGLLPSHVGTLDEQLTRRLKALRALNTNFAKYAFLRELQDINETIFYALLLRHLEELMPIVYTPSVGEGCQRFSEIWKKPRGVFLSYPNKARIPEILANPQFDEVRVIVVSDGERILGLGDQGAGGMGIPIGKLSLYTACAGIHPAQTLPVLLDVGTNNEERLADPLYMGWRNARIRGPEYDGFIEAFIDAATKRWPDALVQWEDFAGNNAARLLDRYRGRLCTFNDDIQGTASVAAATLMAAVDVTGVPLTRQRIAILGMGSAGCGIGAQLLKAMTEAGLSEDEARRRFYAIDRNGLLLESMNDIAPQQRPFVQPRAAVADWKRSTQGQITLHDVAINAQPTALIAVSGTPGMITEPIVAAMARATERPIIFPLSNPTSRAEAVPEDLMKWSDGRAIIGTGSPFPPVRRNGREIPIDQTNNSYIFPGAGLGVLAAKAARVTDSMFMAAAKALAAMSPAKKEPGAPLLPPVSQLREVACKVAVAVAKQAQMDGVARVTGTILEDDIRRQMWEPVYRPYRRPK